MKVSQLKKNPGNPRQIKGDKLDKLKASIGGFQKMMELRPMIVDENNVVIGGNMRLAAIKALGLKEIPDEWVKFAKDLTPDERAQFIITDNSSFGEYDWDAIANEWSEYPLADWGLDVPGFEVVEEVGEADAEPQIDKAAELNKKWGVVSGDLWQIGEHRLLCGDSTNVQTVEGLVGADKVLVFADAPYGINIVGGNGKIGADNLAKNQVYSEIVGDDTTGTAKEFYNTALACGCDRFILWGGNYFTDFLPFSPNWLIWDKRGDMNGNNFADGEMAWTNISTPVRIYKQIWSGMIKEGESGERVHPTQKPVRVCQDILAAFLDVGESVFEGFAGSGTTLVACQNLNRKCYAIEISENYCAVILQRMSDAFPELEIKRVENDESVSASG